MGLHHAFPVHLSLSSSQPSFTHGRFAAIRWTAGSVKLASHVQLQPVFLHCTGLLHEHTRALLDRSLLCLASASRPHTSTCCSCNSNTDMLLACAAPGCVAKHKLIGSDPHSQLHTDTSTQRCSPCQQTHSCRPSSSDQHLCLLQDAGSPPARCTPSPQTSVLQISRLHFVLFCAVLCWRKVSTPNTKETP